MTASICSRSIKKVCPSPIASSSYWAAWEEEARTPTTPRYPGPTTRHSVGRWAGGWVGG